MSQSRVIMLRAWESKSNAVRRSTCRGGREPRVEGGAAVRSAAAVQWLCLAVQDF